MAQPVTAGVIDEFLRQLPHTGSAGFEGLVTLLCERMTGQRFRLAKSGSQHGLDSANERSAANRIKVETKHYFAATLNTRELLGEITQAADSCDLWVLGATCAVPEQLEEELDEEIRKRGCELLILDRGIDAVNRIDALIAKFSDHVVAWATAHGHKLDATAFRREAARIRNLEGFQPCVDALQLKLRGTLLGFADAQTRLHTKLLKTLSDVKDCRGIFKQEITIRGANAKVVRRRDVFRSLDEWWIRSDPECQHAVALGEEGTGKTWAVMDWLAAKCETTFPALIVTVSGGMNNGLGKDMDAEEFLAYCICKATGFRDQEFWTQRLEQWLAEPQTAHRSILLVIDGLNERTAVDWDKFLRRLDLESIRNHVAVLVTDRPGHWGPKCAAKGVAEYVQISISGYTDHELDMALADSGITIADVPTALLPLIRTPRYCSVVCRNFKHLVESGDFTKERVLYIEFEERARRSGGLSRDSMNELLRDLAKHCLDNKSIDRSKFKALVSLHDESRDVLDEIATSGVLVEQPGKLGHSNVERNRFVYGVGLYLAEEARGWGSVRGELDEKLAAWFEPHADMDLKVEIAGSALFHATIQTNYPVAVRRALLGYWLRQRNWHENAQSAFGDYVLRIPEDFVAETELLWADSADLGGAEDLLARTFLAHREAETVRTILQSAIERWLGFVHPSGFPIHRSTPEREQENREAIESRAGGPLRPGSLRLAGEDLTVIDNFSLMRLRRLALLLVSGGPVRPFVKGLVTWAVSSAVMGLADEQSVVNWVVRLAPDGVEADLVAEADKLSQTGEPIALKAGQILLRSAWSARADVLKKRHPEEPSISVRSFRESHAKDPCLSGGVWSDAECIKCMERTDVPTRLILGRIEERLLNPDFRVPESLVQRVTSSLVLNPSTYRASLSQTIESIEFENAIPLLGSRAPMELAQIIRSVIRSITERDQVGVYGLAILAPTVALLMGDSEIVAVRQCVRRLRAAIADPPRNPDPNRWNTVGESYLLAALANALDAEEFVADFLSRPEQALDRLGLENAFQAFPASAIHAVLNRTDWDANAGAIIRALWLLSTSSELLTDTERAKILKHTDSPDPVVRGSISRLAFVKDDEALAAHIVSSRVTYADGARDFESDWGASALSKFSNSLSFEDAATRLHICATSYLVANRGNRADEVKVYAEALHSAWQKVTGADDECLDSLLPLLKVPCEDSPKPRLLEFADEESGTVTLRNASLGWGGGRPFSPEGLKSALTGPAEIDYKRRAEILKKAWSTEAHNWYGHAFCRETIRQIRRMRPDLLEKWRVAALGGSNFADKVRVYGASLLDAMCPVLLEESPREGRELWEALERFGTGSYSLPLDEYLFYADDNEELDEIRWQLLHDRTTDDGIAQIARYAGKHGRREWIRRATERAVTASALETRARGLTLVSFANVSVAEFDELVRQANLAESWLEGVAAGQLRPRVVKNAHAKWWFRKFIEADSVEESWGALQVALHGTDERFKEWPDEFADHPSEEVQRRLRFLRIAETRFERNLNRANDRKQYLFGLKIEAGQHARFLGI